MKKVLVLFLVLFSFFSVFSEGLKELVQEQTLVIDSLQKQVIKPKYDSISKLKSKLLLKQDTLNSLSIDKKELLSINSSLRSRIAELNQVKVKVENDVLQEKVDLLNIEITKLKKIIYQKKMQIEKEKQICVRKSKEEKEKGKQESLHQIIQTYNKPFDELIKSSTINSIERDLSIVRSNIEGQQKLLNLQKYFVAKQVLSEKYNEQKVNSALAQIGSLNQTELVKNLTDLLRKYKLCNDGLITTINRILQIDKQFVANDDYSQKIKLEKILSKLAWYFRNYRFNFSDYPYLSDIVLEIMKLKQKDANTDIEKFLDKL